MSKVSNRKPVDPGPGVADNCRDAFGLSKTIVTFIMDFQHSSNRKTLMEKEK